MILKNQLTEEQFILGLREDLPTLTNERFRRHTPQYWDEVNYYNTLIEMCPKELLLTSLLGNFIYKYTTTNKDLYDLVTEFLNRYDAGDFDTYSYH